MDTDIAPLIAALRPTLGRRGAVVFVHPSELPGPDVPGIPAFAADYLHDTTRAALDLVRAGTVRRHPDLKIILSHGGGYVPYAAYRFAAGLALTEGRTADELPADFGTFYFETGRPRALPSLPSFARPDHLGYGSDWPYAPDTIVAYFAEYLDTLPTPEQQAAINRDNAHTLFPRLLSAQLREGPDSSPST